MSFSPTDDSEKENLFVNRTMTTQKSDIFVEDMVNKVKCNNILTNVSLNLNDSSPKLQRVSLLISPEKRTAYQNNIPFEKDVFRLITSVGQRKNSYEESNLRRLGSALQCSTTEPQRLKGSIPHGYSQFFLCPALMTRRKTSFSISLPSSKLSISLILFTNIPLTTDRVHCN